MEINNIQNQLGAAPIYIYLGMTTCVRITNQEPHPWIKLVLPLSFLSWQPLSGMWVALHLGMEPYEISPIPCWQVNWCAQYTRLVYTTILVTFHACSIWIIPRGYQPGGFMVFWFLKAFHSFAQGSLGLRDSCGIITCQWRYTHQCVLFYALWQVKNIYSSLCLIRKKCDFFWSYIILGIVINI